METDQCPRLQQERKDLREIFALAGHQRPDRAEEKVGGNEEECGRGARRQKPVVQLPPSQGKKTTDVVLEAQ